MSHYDRRFDPQKRHGLHSAEREARWQPRRLLRSLGIQPGHTALDLGCGTGFWTLPLAELVGPTGVVWALDVSQEMLDALAERHPPETVRPLRSELPHIALPDGSVDWIWGAFVVHEVEPLAGLMAEMHRVLRPGGQVALLDWRPDAASMDGPPSHHRLSPAVVTAHLQSAGFEILPSHWQHEDGYLIEAQLPEHKTEPTMSKHLTDYRQHVGAKPDKFYKTTLFQGDSLMIGLNCLEPGQVQPVHDHADQDKFYLVLEGTGVFTVDDDEQAAGPGQIVWTPAGVPHGVRNTGDERLVILVGMAPPLQRKLEATG